MQQNNQDKSGDGNPRKPGQQPPAARRMKGRLNCILQKLRGASQLRHLGWLDVLRCSLLRYDGFKKRWVRNILRTEQLDDLVRVSIGKHVVFWPTGQELDRLIQFYLETFDPRNPHYFESRGAMIASGDVVLDVGGCEGYFAMNAIRAAEVVVIFEPVERLAACLRRTFAGEIQSGAVRLAPVLLGSENKETLFIDTSDDPGLAHILHNNEDSSQAVAMPLRTLDSYLAEAGPERVDFLKVDVEGAELDVLEGARETISRFRPKISIACYHDPDHANQIVQLLLKINPSYKHHVKGIVDFDGVPRPVMAHLWTSERSDSS